LYSWCRRPEALLRRYLSIRTAWVYATGWWKHVATFLFLTLKSLPQLLLQWAVFNFAW
jgi:hypothetical protein